MENEQALNILLATAEAYVRKGCELQEAKTIIFAIEAVSNMIKNQQHLSEKTNKSSK